MGKTSIEWCDYSWPVVNGCRRVSPGCQNCYAERLISTRLSKTPKYSGLAVFNGEPRWTGETRLWKPSLDEPLRTRKAGRWFVADMGDLFYEGVTDKEIAAVFGVMAACPQHTFQILTKRPRRMLDWLERLAMDPFWELAGAASELLHAKHAAALHAQFDHDGNSKQTWPLPNVWLGVSTETQREADERIPLLLQCEAAVRFISAEPLLGPIDLQRLNYSGRDVQHDHVSYGDALNGFEYDGDYSSYTDALQRREQEGWTATNPLDWVIVGGESGPNARACHADWVRGILRQCETADVAAFVKQLGACYEDPDNGVAGAGVKYDEQTIGRPLTRRLNHHKGANILEWPVDLRVRAWPKRSI